MAQGRITVVGAFVGTLITFFLLVLLVGALVRACGWEPPDPKARTETQERPATPATRDTDQKTDRIGD